MPHTKYGGWGRNMKYGKKSGGSTVIVIFAVLAALVLGVALLKQVAKVTSPQRHQKETHR